MSYGKRKKYYKDNTGNRPTRCASIPDDFKKVEAASSSSSARCWERCGDSFRDVPAIKDLNSSGRKLSAVRKLVQSSFSVRNSPTHHDEDPVHIAWSSSESELSDSESRKPKSVAPKRDTLRRPKRPAVPLESFTRELYDLTSDTEDLPIIDTDSDVNSEDELKNNSGEHISDCESEYGPFDGNPKALPLNPTTLSDPGISGSLSNGATSHTVTPSRLDADSEGSKLSISDWVKSAQAMLRTPQKQFDKQSKTPEDSAKKKRKLHSGGLAQRLNRLQSRQRSAFSFWRHLSIPDNFSATVERPGVLVLEVLEVHKECSMQLAQCEHRQPPPGMDHPDSCPLSAARVRILVLFTKETAAQLMPAAKDIVHIYPPWQSLDIEDENTTIVLNTYFSQKVYSEARAANSVIPRALVPAHKCMPYSLTRLFGPHGVNPTEKGDTVKQQAAAGPRGGSRLRDSLLEVIEGLGQAGSVGPELRVVVQRVYYQYVPERSAVSTIKPCAAPPQRGRTRPCALVQDGHGMFSVVQLHILAHDEEELQQHVQRWQGKACVLRDIKVVRRVTRERCTSLFHLIDSVWPPATPLQEGRAPGPAPSFCYVLSGRGGSLEPLEEQSTSPLYLPPAERTLRDVLQGDRDVRRCCSFVATVVYKRLPGYVGQADFWLVLTDPSLQGEEEEEECGGPRRRTVAVRVSTSCVLASSVVEALCSPTACVLSFRDAVIEHGTLLCVDQTVLRLHSMERDGGVDSAAASEPPPRKQARELPRPVRLDPLGPEATPNSLCTLTGVIVGVDENTAYSWPTCSLCGSDRLEMAKENPQAFLCVPCDLVVQKPTVKMQLDVLLSSSVDNCTVKAKLQQSTISSVISAAAFEGNEFPGCEVERVLGTGVGPIPVYVRVVTRKPSLWMAVEEVCL